MLIKWRQMQKKLCAVVAISFFALLQAADASIIKSLSLKDKTITYSQVINLKGFGPNISALKVNGIPIDVVQGGFECRLILKPGKNLVNISAEDAHGNTAKVYRKILRLLTFPDIERLYGNEKHWARHEIITLATLKIIEGYPDNNFYVSNSTTRGEFATWVCKAEGYKTFTPTNDLFADVPYGHWRAPYIKSIVERNIMKGDKDGFFGVDVPILRSEAAPLAIKVEGGAFAKKIIKIFYDVPKTHPFYSQIRLAKESGLIKGVSWQTSIFQPEKDLTRAEAAVLISRFERVKHLEKNLYDFKSGYSSGALCKVSTPPIIENVQITENQIGLYSKDRVGLRAKISDVEGLSTILSVKADISQLGGSQDAQMVDEKHTGDYAIYFVPKVDNSGEKIITITATDLMGDQSRQSIGVLVVR